MHAETTPYKPRCVICGHEPGFMAVVCADCKEGFDLVDEQGPDVQPDTRVAIGPTDV